MAKVNINGKTYDTRSGKLISDVVKKSSTVSIEHQARNTRRKTKISNAASRATFKQPLVVAKPESKINKAAVPAAATAPNPIVVAKPDKKNNDDTTKDDLKRRKKIIRAIIVAIIIVAGLGLLAFFYFPTFSFNFAASQAGVNDASYPSHIVEGYYLDGAVQSESGKVTLNYRNNRGEVYSLSEQDSTWDSEGLLENMIKIKQLDYKVLTQQGLIIYQLKDGAVWINGGILYTISRGEQLGNDQILKIAAGV